VPSDSIGSDDEQAIHEGRTVRTIHRYPLSPGFNEIAMPTGAMVLSVHSKLNDPQVWALVDDACQTEERRGLYVAATGENLDALHGADLSVFIGTVFVDTICTVPAGNTPPASAHAIVETLVFHVFETTWRGPREGR